MTDKSIEQPVVVRPVIYELPLNLWQWCRIGEVCAIIPQVARIGGFEFNPTIPELIRKFAVLAKAYSLGGGDRKKLFYFSPDGNEIGIKKIPLGLPLGEFHLDLPPEAFVVRDWAEDALRLIRMGCFEARIYKEEVVGIRREGDCNYFVRL